ncbi:MAG: tRNA pseudouridine(38-40) synthase TruA [Candidatus Asgardarchaeia archaeon]
MRFSLKVVYLGFYYDGYQRQKHTKNTIEENIINALKKAGYISDVKSSKFQSASRTDKGVSALGQTVAFSTQKEKIHIGLINHFLPESIKVWAVATVNEEFNPRKDAQMKHYTYIIPKDEINNLKRIVKIAKLLEGQKYNFKYLSIKDKNEKNPILSINEIKVSSKKTSNLIFIDFFGKRFLYGQIRKIITLMMLYEKKKVTINDVKKILNGEKIKVSIAPANATRLILMDVFYKNLKFEPNNVVALKIINRFIEHYKNFLVKSEISKIIIDGLRIKMKEANL